MTSSHQTPPGALGLRTPAPLIREEVSLPALATLVVWVSVLTVGLLGFWLHYPQLHVAADPVAVQAELLRVDLKTAPLDASPAAPAAVRPETPRTGSEVPPLPLMAEISPATAFIQPLALPPAAATTKAATASAPAAGSAAAQLLDWDHGDDQQPRPEYPRRAVLEGQQGTVQLRFRVDAAGRVATVEVTDPSPWPLLNQAATTAIQKTWRFRPGRVRWYQVPIRFQLEN